MIYRKGSKIRAKCLYKMFCNQNGGIQKTQLFGMSLTVSCELWVCLFSVIKVGSYIIFLDRKFEGSSKKQSEIWLIESINLEFFQGDMDFIKFLLNFAVKRFDRSCIRLLVISVRAEHIFHLHRILSIFINLSVYLACWL